MERQKLGRTSPEQLTAVVGYAAGGGEGPGGRVCYVYDVDKRVRRWEGREGGGERGRAGRITCLSPTDLNCHYQKVHPIMKVQDERVSKNLLECMSTVLWPSAGGLHALSLRSRSQGGHGGLPDGPRVDPSPNRNRNRTHAYRHSHPSPPLPCIVFRMS